MKRSEVNRDPKRAQARALSDFRCAVKKLANEVSESSEGEALFLVQLADGIEDVVANHRNGEGEAMEGVIARLVS